MMTRIAAFVILAAEGADSPAGKWNTVGETVRKVTSEVEIFEPGGAV